MDEYLGFDRFIDVQDTTRLLFRLFIELLSAWLVIQRVYCQRYKSSEHTLTFWLFSVVTFSIAFLLRKVPMELGFALGLFAVFGVLRYRTESIGVKDLTYLFVVIGLALINALSNRKISFAELMIVNLAITGTVVLLDGRHRRSHEGSLTVLFDRVDLLGPDNRESLLAELRRRMRIEPTRVVVHEVDLLRDTARLSVFFAELRAPASGDRAARGPLVQPPLPVGGAGLS
ncbi:MAG TPA: DUF4956 domain-containing protein [Polyangiaceae bacterium]|nr:DUF4956 domain-containing protein [Polyangiaceae bacterium]